MVLTAVPAVSTRVDGCREADAVTLLPRCPPRGRKGKVLECSRHHPALPAPGAHSCCWPRWASPCSSLQKTCKLPEVELKRVFTGTGLSIHVELVARVAFTVEGAGGAHAAVLASVVPFHAHVHPWKAERASERPPKCSLPTLLHRETHRADCQHTDTGTSTVCTGF